MSRYTSFSVELTGALDAAQQLSTVPGRIAQAQKRALGTVRRRLATEAKRDIAAEYNLKAGRIADGLNVRNQSDGIALIGRARGKRFVALSCPERIVFDQSLDFVPEESARHRRKGADDD